MRLIIFFFLGVFLWAGTVSIQYPQRSSPATTSTKQSCSGSSHGDKLLSYLKVGTITSILDNGRMLTIGLSPQWAKFSLTLQQQTYVTVSCYAQSLHRQFQFQITQKM